MKEILIMKMKKRKSPPNLRMKDLFQVVKKKMSAAESKETAEEALLPRKKLKERMKQYVTGPTRTFNFKKINENK